MSPHSDLNRLSLLVLALALFAVGCSSSEVPTGVPAAERLGDYVASVENALAGASPQELAMVAEEMSVSIKDYQKKLRGEESEVAEQLATQVEQFASAASSEPRKKLAERVDAMQATVGKLQPVQ